ncbi:MAG: 50S ribosomal protein L25, partial [Armatimonadota bacterium]
MEQITLKARLRGQDELGKGPAKRIRAAGDVPGVAYGHGREPVSIAVNARELTTAIRAGANVLVDLQIEGLQAEDGTLAIIKDTQRHPITDRYLSVDLQWISLTEKIAVRVPLVLDGTPVGVQEGGFVEHFLREVEITGIATEIPDAIHADVSHLDIGESLHVRDLQVPPEAELAAHP